MKDMDTDGLSTLDTLFANQPLSNPSTKLRIIIYGDVDRGVFRAVLKDKLPKLDGRKQLELLE